MSKSIAFLLIVSCAIFAVRAGFATNDESSASSIIVKSDTGRIGGSVQLEALPSPTDSNRIRKLFTIENADVLEKIRSAEVQMFAALRDPTDRNDFSFDAWEWIFFSLNEHGWVVRVEDMPLHRRSLFDIKALPQNLWVSGAAHGRPTRSGRVALVGRG